MRRGRQEKRGVAVVVVVFVVDFVVAFVVVCVVVVFLVFVGQLSVSPK